MAKSIKWQYGQPAPKTWRETADILRKLQTKPMSQKKPRPQTGKDK